MDTVDPARFIFAFLFVLALIGLCAVALRRYSRTASSKLFLGRGLLNPLPQSNRLEVLEVRYIDARRKLVLVRRDQVEHLLLLADNREVVIESITLSSQPTTDSANDNA